MAKIIWTEPAIQQLDTIADYISLENPKSAKKLMRKIFGRTDHWKQLPRSGVPVRELPLSMYGEVDISPCRILFRYDETTNIRYIIHICRE